MSQSAVNTERAYRDGLPVTAMLWLQRWSFVIGSAFFAVGTAPGFARSPAQDLPHRNLTRDGKQVSPDFC
jgi:hypothetical protein